MIDPDVIPQERPLALGKLFELIKQAMGVVNAHGRLLGGNAALAALSGFAPAELEGKTIFEIDPHLNLIQWKKLWAQLGETLLIHRDSALMTSDEQLLPVKERLTRLTLDGDEFILISFQSESPQVSDHAAPSEELENQLYIANFTLHQTRDLIFWIRSDGTFYYVNEAAAENLEYTPAELMAIKVDTIAPEFTGKVWEEHWARIQQEEYLELEVDCISKSGKTVPLWVGIHYIRYEGKEYNISICRNLSRKQKRDQFIETASLSLDQSHDIILWCDESGGLFYKNQKADQRLGFHKTSVKPLTILSLLQSEEDQPVTMKMISAAADQDRETQLKVLDQQGRMIPVEASINRVQSSGKTIYCLALRDISRRLEQQAELTEAFRRITALKEKLLEEKKYLQAEITKDYSFLNIVSKSPKYRKVLRQVSQVADSTATVLILGETGTGKELLARAIHSISDRSEEPMIKVNCATLPENLFESELFGHEKGAFTGAYQRKIGRFELADKGTIFLDEIGEMPLELQPKLLRVLQEGEYERLGNPKTFKTDVRVIAATNRNLEEAVMKGAFREDLYYRLNVFPIRNLTLRERKEDIPLLVRHFIKKHQKRMGRKVSRIPEKDLKRLMEYEFPGNVRELENLIERALIVSTDDTLNLNSILPQIQKSPGKASTSFPTFEEIQRQHILEALNRTNWRISGELGAGRLLGLNDKTLASKMRKFGIRREDFMKI